MMTSFQIHLQFRKSLDKGADVAVAAKKCADELVKHGHLLPIGHQGPLKAQ